MGLIPQQQSLPAEVPLAIFRLSRALIGRCSAASPSADVIGTGIRDHARRRTPSDDFPTSPGRFGVGTLTLSEMA